MSNYQTESTPPKSTFALSSWTIYTGIPAKNKETTCTGYPAETKTGRQRGWQRVSTLSDLFQPTTRVAC
jgi:phage protein D